MICDVDFVKVGIVDNRQEDRFIGEQKNRTLENMRAVVNRLVCRRPLPLGELLDKRGLGIANFPSTVEVRAAAAVEDAETSRLMDNLHQLFW